MQLADGQLSPDMHQQALEALTTPVLVIGGERLVYANQAARELASTLQGGVGSRRAVELDDFAQLECEMGRRLREADLPWKRIAAGEKLAGLELGHRGADGNVRLLSFGGRSMGTGDHVVLTVEEITARYRQDAFFDSVFESGPIPMTLLRLRDRRIVGANRAFLDLVQLTRDEFVGKTPMEVAAMDSTSAPNGFAEGWNKGVHEVILKGKGSGPLTLLVSNQTMMVNGESCSLSIYQDITEARTTEHRLREATQIVLQNAAEFSRGVVQQLERLRGPGRSSSTYTELSLLTRREHDVIVRVGAGHSNQRIAQELSLTPQTVRNYVTRIYQKIGVGNRAEAVVWARERGLVES